MIPLPTLESKINKNERSLKRFIADLETFEIESGKLFEELEFSPEQLSEFMGKQENFTPERWEEYQRRVREFDAALEKDKTNIKDTRRNSETYEILRMANNWIRVN